MFELNNGRELILDIVTKIIFTEKTPPKAFVAQLLFHTNQDLTLSNKPKTLFEVVNHSLVIYICREKKIKMTGCKMVENMPFKNATIYQHEYKTEQGEVFYCYQFGNSPIASSEQLASNMIESTINTGCVSCMYKGYSEDDIECAICRNGMIRNLFLQQDGIKGFKEFGLPMFNKAIGENFANILKDFSEYHYKYMTEEQGNFDFSIDLESEIVKYVTGEEMGSYLGKEAEASFFMIEDELQQEEDE
jgi:hypothetical protein